VHVHTPVASIAGRLAAFVAGVGIKIYTVHGFILKPRIYYLIEKFMARFFTDYIFTVNREDMDLAIAKRFITRDKILNINSVGIDTSHFDPDLGSDAVKEQLRKSLNIKEDERVIGYVGRIAKSKGLLDLVHAYMNVRKEYDCKLLLVGPCDLNERADDAVIEEIGHLIEKNVMGDDVLLPGYRHDIAELLSIMDIFVLPSYREGMPVSLLEAMAMEKAVIGTNIRGIKEEITAESGLIYEPGDVGELVKCIKFYMDNEDKASLMGKNARQRVVDYFSQEQVLGRQMKVFLKYKNVVGRDKG
jgi:glycosyltransferase involved in cell wall biosynthesis